MFTESVWWQSRHCVLSYSSLRGHEIANPPPLPTPLSGKQLREKDREDKMAE